MSGDTGLHVPTGSARQSRVGSCCCEKVARISSVRQTIPVDLISSGRRQYLEKQNWAQGPAAAAPRSTASSARGRASTCTHRTGLMVWPACVKTSSKPVFQDALVGTKPRQALWGRVTTHSIQSPSSMAWGANAASMRPHRLLHRRRRGPPRCAGRGRPTQAGANHCAAPASRVRAQPQGLAGEPACPKATGHRPRPGR